MAKVNFKRCATISDLSNIDIVDGNFIVTGDGKTYIDYGNERKGIGGTPDLEMSDSSTNTVQNRIIKQYIDNFIPKGTINAYAGATAPNGWLICDGTAISRTTYADLFAIIGTSYGTGDGSTTFNLPNLKGKVVTGYDISDTDFNSLGKTGGEKTHMQTLLENYWTIEGQNPSASSGGTGGYLVAHSADAQEAFNVMQPYIALNYIIKY